MFARVTMLEDGSAMLEGLVPLHVAAIVSVPGLVDKPGGDVKRRLFPDPSDEAKQREDWERLVRPELFALLASAREIVLRDLRGLTPQEPFLGLPQWGIKIPKQHLNAWVSALNAARLALGVQQKIEKEEDLHPELHPEDPDFKLDEHTAAVLKINALAEIQALLITEGMGLGEGEDNPSEPERE